MRILLTGASGLLGRAVHSLLQRWLDSNNSHSLIAWCGRRQRDGCTSVDFTNSAAIAEALLKADVSAFLAQSDV